jgi:hypothetical protein
MSATVIRTTEPETLDEIRVALVDAFERVQVAISTGDSVAIVVPSPDLLGHRGPERGAYVGALVGIVRAVAFEGTRAGWQANVLAVPSGHEISDAEVVNHFPEGVSGQVVTVGTALVGKVAP